MEDEDEHGEDGRSEGAEVVNNEGGQGGGPGEGMTEAEYNKETKGVQLPKVNKYRFPPLHSGSPGAVNDPYSPCERCVNNGISCYGWPGWSCYMCKARKVGCTLRIFDRWKTETKSRLANNTLKGFIEPPKALLDAISTMEAKVQEPTAAESAAGRVSKKRAKSRDVASGDDEVAKGKGKSTVGKRTKCE